MQLHMQSIVGITALPFVTTSAFLLDHADVARLAHMRHA